jgi:hypothetical protein
MGDERDRSARKGSRGKTERPEAQGSPSGRPTHIVWALVSAVVLVVFAPGLFVAGFFTNELVNDDEGGGGGGGGGTSPTPAPVVAATADDDPFIGPEDAPVTIIGFTDYQ